MKIDKSQKLQDLVTTKIDQGLRNHIKKTCTATSSCSKTSFYSLLEGMKLASSLHTGTAPDLLYAKANQAVFFFSLTTNSENEWCDILENLNKKVTPLPRKVLVKMTALRIRKLFVARDNHNKASGASSRMMMPRFPDLKTIDSLAHAKILAQQGFAQKHYGSGWIQEYFDPFTPILAKEGFDDSIMEEAWNLHVTQEVMES